MKAAHFNPFARGAEARAAHWRAVQEMVEGDVEQATSQIRKHMDREAMAVADAVEDGVWWEGEIDDAAMEKILFDAIYQPTYLRFARAAYGASETAAKKAASPETVQAWIEQVLRILGETAATRIKGIGDTTKDKVRYILLEAQSEGLGVQEAARRLRKRLPELNVTRAERIARTELNSTASAGTMAGVDSAAVELGLNIEKVWFTSPDDRVRDSHALANGQTVPRDQPFNVGGVAMMHPGEFDAPADEVINCRCTMLFEVAE